MWNSDKLVGRSASCEKIRSVGFLLRKRHKHRYTRTSQVPSTRIVHRHRHTPRRWGAGGVFPHRPRNDRVVSQVRQFIFPRHGRHVRNRHRFWKVLFGECAAQRGRHRLGLLLHIQTGHRRRHGILSTHRDCASMRRGQLRRRSARLLQLVHQRTRRLRQNDQGLGSADHCTRRWWLHRPQCRPMLDLRDFVDRRRTTQHWTSRQWFAKILQANFFLHFCHSF